MNKLITFFSGKKTILTGLLMVGLGYNTDDMKTVLEGVAIIFLRLGISKIK